MDAVKSDGGYGLVYGVDGLGEVRSPGSYSEHSPAGSIETTVAA